MNNFVNYLKRKKWEILQVFLFIGSIGVLCLFMTLRIDNLLDSDTASQLVMSDLLAKERKLLSGNWHYSTEIRVLSYQLIFVPLFWVTSNWRVVRIVGSIILCAIMLMSLYYLCYQLGINKYFFSVATILVLPFSKQYFLYVLKNINYMIPITISFFAIGFALHFVKCKSRKMRIIIGMLAGGLALFSGMNGLRSIFSTYIPLFLGSCLMDGLNIVEEREKHKEMSMSRLFRGCDIPFVLISTWVLVCSGIGYLINKIYLSQIATYKDYNNASQWDMFSFEDVDNVIAGWMINLGYVESGNLFSTSIVHNAVGILLFVTVVGTIIKVLRNMGRYTCELRILSLFFVCACGMSLLLYGFTTQQQFPRYDLPIIVFCFPLLVSFVANTNIAENKKRIVLTLGVLIVICSSVLFYDEYSGVNDTRELKEAAEYLTENGYKEGYGTFWNGNVLTELSNGEISVRVWQSGDLDIGIVDQTKKWESPVAHDITIPEGKVFWILTKEENEIFTIARKVGNDYIVYDNYKYVIYGFDSYEEMVSLLTIDEFLIDFNDYGYLSGGEDVDGVRHLFYDGKSAGPYIPLYPGTYRITCEGQGLDNVEIWNTAVLNEHWISLEMISESRTKNRISYELRVEQSVADYQVQVYNPTVNEVELTGIKIEKVE